VLQALLRRVQNGDRAAEAAPGAKPAPPKPSVGLALGGGAARGFAHIGIIRTLIANGIVPDVIVGTSIGAVAGGCYSAGQLDAFEDWARGLTVRGVLGYLDLSLSGSGIINGGRLAAKLEDAVGKRKIEELPHHFAAIATEVLTGHEIWLTRGRLVEAMRASYALPGVFTPIHLGGRWLVDGALVNPVPVSAARALGARLVIAVNLNADLFGRGTVISAHGSDESDEFPPEAAQTLPPSHGPIPERILKRQIFGSAARPGLTSVMIDAFNIMQDRVTRSRLAGDPPDIIINPRLGRIGLFDFHRAKDIIAIGAHATEKAMEDITDTIAMLG
jgi:NTE family protein